MFHYRHDLDMGISHILYVRDKLLRDLPVIERLASGITAPGTEVNLVNIDRFTVYRFPVAFFHPLVVGEPKPRKIVHFRAGIAVGLVMVGIRVLLKKSRPLFVM